LLVERARALPPMRMRWPSLMPAFRAWALVGIGYLRREGMAKAEAGSLARCLAVMWQRWQSGSTMWRRTCQRTWLPMDAP
jgi:hypothetical protein